MCTKSKAVFATLALAASLSLSSPARAETLMELSLEQPQSLGLALAADPSVKTEGTASIKVTTAWPTVINLAEVDGPEIEAATLVYQADVRSEDLSGNAYLEMWCHFSDGGSYFSRGLDSTITGSSDWRRLATRFFLQAGQTPSRVTLNLVVNGKGSVWIDKVALSREPLPQ